MNVVMSVHAMPAQIILHYTRIHYTRIHYTLWSVV